MANKKINERQSGYSITDTKKMLNKYVEESAGRLQKKLRTACKKQSSFSKKLSYA